MARILNEMPRKSGGIGRKAIYPYDQWLDGQVWQLDKDEDFKAKPQSVVASIRGAATARGMKLRSRFVVDDQKGITGIAIQAFNPEQDESIEAVPAPVELPKSPRRARRPARQPAAA